MNIIKKVFPIFIKDFIKNIIFKINQNKNIYYCPVCNKKINGFNKIDEAYFKEWDKNQFIHSIFCFETLNFLFYSCKKCGASDRDRLSALFLKEKLLKNGNKKYKIIDFAPSAVSELIKNSKEVEYVSADLNAKNVDINIDIQEMSALNENHFDAFICSHVLEHVLNDVKALSELYRILKYGGWGILMVPISLNLNNDYENNNNISESERWKHFGQNDHLRLYSKRGFLEKVKNAGFSLKQLDVDYFGKDIFTKSGINNRSVLYIVEKNVG